MRVISSLMFLQPKRNNKEEKVIECKHHIETLHVITVLLLLNIFFFTAYPVLVKLGAGHTILVSVIGSFGIRAATTDKQANKGKKTACQFVAHNM